MNESRTNQPQLEYTCSTGIAKVNLYNGRLSFEHPLLSVGGGNFQININLLYDSQMSLNLPNINTGLGLNWKLNVNQYLIKDNYDYVYYDGSGFKHKFVQYKTKDTNTLGEFVNSYYDETGTGLRLVESININTNQVLNKYIIDEVGNKIEFSNDGNILSVISGINNNVKKVYTYSDGFLISIYDNRDHTKKVNFHYDSSNKLISISSNLKHDYNFIYEGNNLLIIKKKVGNASKTRTSFLYNSTNKLEYIISYDKSSLVFEYNDNKIIKIITGVVEETRNYSSINLQSNYLGDDIFLGDDIYLGKTYKKFNGYNYTLPITNIKQYNIFDYSNLPVSTLITSEKNIKFRYFFNEFGFISAIFEEVSINDYKTLFKTSGWELSNQGLDNIKINNKKVVNINSNSYNIPMDKINDFKSIFSNYSNKAPRKHKYTDSFVVSFWVKFSANQTNVKVKFNYKSTVKVDVKYVYVDVTIDEDSNGFIGNIVANTWKYVTIPLNFDRVDKYININTDDIPLIKENINSMILSFENNNSSIYIGDLRIAVGSNNDIILEEKDFNLVDKIKFDDLYTSVSYDETISSSFFMNESDILKTYKSMFDNKSNSNFDLIMCDSTKIYSVAEVSCKFKTLITYDKFSLDTNGIPNYYTQNINRCDKNKWQLIETQVRFFDEYYEVKTTVDFGNTIKSKPGHKSSKIYNWTNYNGLPRANKDEYNIITHNYYDDYGNITSIKTFNEYSFNNECLITNYNYKNTQILRELPSSITENGVTTLYTYDENDLTIESEETNELEKSYNYDLFKDYLAKTTYKYETNEESNTFKIDLHGRLTQRTNENGLKYRFEYNLFGDPYKYYENDILILKKEIQRNINYFDISNADVIVETKYGINNFGITTIIDKYGKVKEIKNNDKSIKYYYQDDSNPYLPNEEHINNFNESSTVSKVTKIEDPYENDVYSYYYDEENNPCGYSIISNYGFKKLDVIQVTDIKTEYKQVNEVDRYSIILKDDSDSIINKSINTNKKYINQRIIETIDKNNNFSSNQKEFEKVYYYDELGRVNKITTPFCNIGSMNAIKLYTVNEYENGKQIIKKQTHNCDHGHFLNGEDYFNLSFENIYEYDTTNCLTKYKEIGKGFKKVPRVFNRGEFSILDKMIDYSYDKLNRLVEEDNSELGLFEYNYDVNGIKNVKHNNNIVKTFIYTNGKLVNYYDTTDYIIYYNDYGNMINYLDTNLIWDSNNNLKNYGEYEYKYNYQKVRTEKYINNILKAYYYLDGSKILGESYIDDDNNNYRLRYFYDATGIAGINYKNNNYSFIKDILGNVIKIMCRGKMVAEYIYDAWGNVTTNNLGEMTIDEEFIVDYNPFRWKSYYYDKESGLYYINGRYYSPILMIYIDAYTPEYILTQTNLMRNINRYAITNDNPLSTNNNSDSIFTVIDLSSDPINDPNITKTWWELNWKKAVQWIVFAVVLITAIILACFPATSTFGFGMLEAGLKGAISGMIIGGAIGGINSYIRGDYFLEGLTQGVIYGAINGFSAGVIIHCIGEGVKALVKIVNQSKLPSTQCFIAGTLVLTNEGHKKIEDIKVGDKVLAYEELTGVNEYKEVVNVFKNEVWLKTTLDIKADNGTIDQIVSTPGHKYYLPFNTESREIGEVHEHDGYESLSVKWVSACNLKIGDRVMLATENPLTGKPKYGIVANVKTEQLDEPIAVYNFEVQDFHTYYVGKHSVCMHNTKCGLNSVDDLVLSSKKNAGYVAKRGWTMETMDTAIKGGVKGTSTNLATNNLANVYTASNGSYLIADSVTRQLVQLSPYGNMVGWIPSPPIIWF